MPMLNITTEDQNKLNRLAKISLIHSVFFPFQFFLADQILATNILEDALQFYEIFTLPGLIVGTVSFFQNEYYPIESSFIRYLQYIFNSMLTTVYWTYLYQILLMDTFVVLITGLALSTITILPVLFLYNAFFQFHEHSSDDSYHQNISIQ